MLLHFMILDTKNLTFSTMRKDSGDYFISKFFVKKR